MWKAFLMMVFYDMTLPNFHSVCSGLGGGDGEFVIFIGAYQVYSNEKIARTLDIF